MECLLNRLFTHDHKLFLKLTLIFALFFGAINWIALLNWGDFSSSAFDWPKELAYASLIRESLLEGEIPLYMSREFQGTNLFFSLPESNLSPQILTLAFLPPDTFIVFNAVFLYLIGATGVVLVQKCFRLTPAAGLFLLIVFSFNGYIVSHVTVGHSMWLGCFLLPYFFASIHYATNREVFKKSVVLCSLVLFAMLLQGSFHLWVWCLIYLAILGFSDQKLRRFSFASIAATIAIGLFRILPAAVFLYPKSEYLSGFISTWDLILSFIELRGPSYSYVGGVFSNFRLGWWEFNLYVGFGAFCILIYFGVFRGLFVSDLRIHSVHRWPVLVMTLLATPDVYGFIAQLPIPFIEVERISARFMILPLMALLILSADTVSRAEISGQKYKVTLLFILLFTFFDLLQHLNLWKLARLSTLAGSRIYEPNARYTYIVSGNNELYEVVLGYSLIFSLISLIVILIYGFGVRENNNAGLSVSEKLTGR